MADAPDLGSGVHDVKVQVLSPAPHFVRKALFIGLFMRLKLNTYSINFGRIKAPENLRHPYGSTL